MKLTSIVPLGLFVFLVGPLMLLQANVVGSGGTHAQTGSQSDTAQLESATAKSSRNSNANGSSHSEWFIPDFTPAELEQSERELQKSQLVTQLIHAFRFRSDSIVPGLIARLENLAPDAAELYFFKAMQAYRNSEKGQALVYIDSCHSRNPEYARAWNLKGVIQSEAAQYDEALDSFEKALRWAPFNPVYLYNTASLYYRTRQYQKAEEKIAEALQAKINLAEGYYLQGLILRDRKKLRQSSQSFATARHYGQSGPQFMLQYAEVALEANSKKDMLELIQILPRLGTVPASQLSARIHDRFGEYNKSVIYYARICRSKDATKQDRENYAIALAHTSQFGERYLSRLSIEDTEKRELLKLYTDTRDRLRQSPEIKDQILKPFK